MISVWTSDSVDSPVFLVPPCSLIRIHKAFWVPCLPCTNHEQSKLPPQVKYLDNTLLSCCVITPYPFWTSWQSEWRASLKAVQPPSSYDPGSVLLAPSVLMVSQILVPDFHYAQTLWDFSLEGSQDIFFWLFASSSLSLLRTQHKTRRIGLSHVAEIYYILNSLFPFGLWFNSQHLRV